MLVRVGLIPTLHDYLSESTLILWKRTLIEKLIVAQLVKKFPALMEPEDLLPCSQKTTNKLFKKVCAA
jgi:hypothetical protein